jgi:predicted AAA+ superfamily ATPase
MSENPDPAFYINFDTPGLYTFELSDFGILDQVIDGAGCKRLFFDEIQVITGWELYVRQKLDEGFQVVVTGSNASLLSQELGTKLTGRHITKELYPFSFNEFVRFLQLPPDRLALQQYLDNGGFPEYLRSRDEDILVALFDDILYRDIAVRYGIRDIKSFKWLLLYLVANVGNLVTATGLTKVLSIRSTSTVLDYFSFLEQSYLLGLMPRFSWSLRAQLVNPRKIYIIDNGLINAVSPSYTMDYGKKLENAVYWELRQQQKELHYFNESGYECDFVVTRKNKVESVIQVCWDLNAENSAREERGLMDAMNFFKLNTGLIITQDKQDEIHRDGKQIHVVPAYRFFQKPPGNLQ